MTAATGGVAGTVATFESPVGMPPPAIGMVAITEVTRHAAQRMVRIGCRSGILYGTVSWWFLWQLRNSERTTQAAMAAAAVKRRHAREATSAPRAPCAASKRPAAERTGSVFRYDDVPLLVTVVGGNAVTAAAVFGCLNTADATALRRLHPVLAAHVAAVSWADITTGVLDTVRWRAALPAAVACKLGRYYVRFEPAALRGVTVLDLNRGCSVTDADVADLPPTLRRLDVSVCGGLTEGVSFTHLPVLEWLDCTATAVKLAGLPHTLRELIILPCKAADFSHLRSLRVLDCSGLSNAKSIASLPPSLEELDVTIAERYWPRDWSAAHLTRLRVLRAGSCGIHAAALATLPPSLQVLDLADCKELTEGTSFAHLARLHTLNLQRADVHNDMLGTLPPSLVSLNLEGEFDGCGYLTQEAAFPHLPALRFLNMNYTGIGDAAVASLPRCLEELHMVDCHKVTQHARLDHLAALRVLQSSGTDLPRTTIEACRSRGCYAPADGILCKKFSCGPSVTAVALLVSGRMVSCTSDGWVSLWDASRGGDAVAKLQISAQCNAIAALPDGHRVAIGKSPFGRDSSGGGIVMWDTSSASDATPVSIDCGVEVCQLAVLHNGHLVAGCKDGKLCVVDADAGAVVATLEGHASVKSSTACGNEVQALAVLLDGRVASTARGSMVWVWDMGRRVCVDRLVGHTDVVAVLAALPDGRLASGSWDTTVRLWDLRSRSSVSLFTGYTVTALAALPGGRLASASWEGKLTVWNTRNTTGAPPVPVTTTLESIGTSTLVPLPDGRLATRAIGLRLWQLPLDVVQAPL